MTWAFKRQIFYVVVLFLIVSIFGFLIILPSLNKAPTCADNIKNGNETGVDCGGSCALACIVQVDQVSILWARAFKIVPGRYNAVAYLENHNRNIAVNKINYRFRFADSDNIYIGKREGTTTIPPAGQFAIFEPAVGVGYSVPVYATFEFLETPVWVNVGEEKINQLKVFVSNILLENQDTMPRMSATIKNNSLYIIPKLDVVTILYDEKGNAVTTSRTYLDVLRAEESVDINFTWPEPILPKIVVKEIIPMYNIFLAKLK